MKVENSSLMKRLSGPDAKKLLERMNAVVMDSHFVYSQPTGHGDHGPHYVNKDVLYTDPDCVAALSLEMAWRMRDMKIANDISVIIGPEKGAIILSSWVSFFHQQLRKTVLPGAHKIHGAFAEKREKGGFELRRGYDAIVKGQKVLVVEDILNSGGSAKEAVDAVREAGGEPVGVIAICNRGGVTAEMLGVGHLDQLVSFNFEKYPEGTCPLCDQDVPINELLGHGRDFLRRQREQP